MWAFGRPGWKCHGRHLLPTTHSAAPCYLWLPESLGWRSLPLKFRWYMSLSLYSSFSSRPQDHVYELLNTIDACQCHFDIVRSFTILFCSAVKEQARSGWVWIGWHETRRMVPSVVAPGLYRLFFFLRWGVNNKG